MPYEIEFPAINPEVPRTLHAHFELFEALEPDDRVGLTFLAIARTSQGRLFERGKPITKADLNRCLLVTAEAFLSAGECPEHDPARRMALRVELLNHAEHWFEELDNTLKNALTHPADEREAQLVEAWSAIVRDCGPKRDFDQFRRAVRGVARGRLDMPPLHDRKDVVAHVKLVRHLTFGEEPGLFRALDGRIHLGWRNVRDVLGPALGAKRLRKPRKGAKSEPDTVVPATVVDSELTADAADGGEGPEAIACHEDGLAVALAVLDRMRRGAEPGTARRLALDHREDLRTGRVTAKALAAKAGIDAGALSKAQKAIQAELSKALGEI